MWFFKRKSKILITECDALQDAIDHMQMFEEKYHITSAEVHARTCDLAIFEDDDIYFWEMYIRNYIRCGGVLKTVTIPENDYKLECSTLNENENQNIKINDIIKETANKPFLFILCKICNISMVCKEFCGF